MIRPKMRLDLFMSERGFADSRTDAKNFIVGGFVKVDGKTVTKPEYDVSEKSEIVVDKSSKKYVSRGGLKLEGAISEFGVEVCGRLAIDIGSSSGGFTDCLLKHGAAHVIAVDSGTDQLVSVLRENPAVTVIEGYNARYMKPEDFEYEPSLAVMDVSFISATFIFSSLHGVLADGGDFICLIKPQFEVGREHIGKGGIVKSESARACAVDKVIASARTCGFEYVAHTESSIQGGDGNVEYVAHFINRK